MLSKLILFSQICLSAAWGRLGHEMVGNLAWHLLPPKTQQKIEAILVRDDGSYGNDNCTACSPLGMVADWADTVRHSHFYNWSGPLHYVDVRDDLVQGGCPAISNSTAPEACHFLYSRDCPNDICAAGAVVNYTAQVTSETDKFRRRDALMFLTHFVGDLHQPLHVSRTTDRGGNSIHVSYKVNRSSNNNTHSRLRKRAKKHHHHSAKNLHAVWDDALIETCLERNFNASRLAMEGSLMHDIAKAQSTGEWDTWLACPDGSSSNCTIQWAEEALMMALEWAYRGTDGNDISSGAVLTEDYYESRIPIVRQQLSIASARLASTIGAALSS